MIAVATRVPTRRRASAGASRPIRSSIDVRAGVGGEEVGLDHRVYCSVCADLLEERQRASPRRRESTSPGPISACGSRSAARGPERVDDRGEELQRAAGALVGRQAAPAVVHEVDQLGVERIGRPAIALLEVVGRASCASRRVGVGLRGRLEVSRSCSA